jgi:micrococcal nuclease
MLIVKILFGTLVVSLVTACSTSTTAHGVRDLEPRNMVEVVRVIDGDTLDLIISNVTHRVRLFGVDTPERGEPCYHEATERLRQLAGDVVRVEPGPRAADNYGRLLFYLYTTSGESIDAMLISEGLGTAWIRDGQYRDLLASLEREAKVQVIGCLW